MSTGLDPKITLSQDDGWWVATHVPTGVTSQGRTRKTALDNLDEAVAGYKGEGREPTDEELRELGIDPANNEPGQGELPDVLQ